MGRRAGFFAYAPPVLWACLILILGSSPGSAAQTSRFIKPLIEFFFPHASPDSFLIIHALIRKAAHFVEYGVLALLAARAFSISGVRKWAMPAFITSLAVASIDEIGQSFQAARTGSVWDVLLDMAGASAGLLLFLFFRRRKANASA